MTMKSGVIYRNRLGEVMSTKEVVKGSVRHISEKRAIYYTALIVTLILIVQLFVTGIGH